MNTPLKKIRKEKGKTLHEVASAVGIDPSNLSRIERGQQAATPKIAEDLAAFFANQVSEIEILYPARFAECA